MVTSDDLWGQNLRFHVIPGTNMKVYIQHCILRCFCFGVIWKNLNLAIFLSKIGQNEVRGGLENGHMQFFFFQNPFLNPKASFCHVGQKSENLTPPLLIRQGVEQSPHLPLRGTMYQTFKPCPYIWGNCGCFYHSLPPIWSTCQA